MLLKLSLLFSFLVLSLWCGVRVRAQGNWTTTPFNPPSMPLAVKSPYLNAWLPLGNNSGALNRAWPNTFPADGILGWYASIRVDGEAYILMGASPLPITHAIQQSLTFTPTRSSYIMQAGPVNVNMTFLSPVEAKDIVRQSTPFSYLYFDVESTDGNPHSIQIYSDVSGEFISGDTSLTSSWQINESSNFVYLQMQLTTPSPFQEISNRAQDSTMYYCAEKGNLTWQIAPADDIRMFFANGTGLNNQAESGPPHPIDSPFTNMGIAVNLGSISSTDKPVVYAIGVVRDPVIRYANRLVQIEQRSAYYWSEFTNIHDAIKDVLDHFSDALSGAIEFDNKILGLAGDISGRYADILSLSTRQAMGALDYTILKRADGTFNASDIKAFMKNMGDIGSSGVNPVDVLYASMPMYLYLNPDILGYLLSPLLEYQGSTQYRNPYAAQNLGGPYPNATGNPDGHDQKIEHSASMLIMSLAHAQASGDGSLLVQHYDILNQWASYLVNNTMNPGAETTSTSDGIRSSDQSNLVLKGIIGIGSMAKISEYTKRSDDQTHYNVIASQYIAQWTTRAASSSQIDLSFGSGSSGLIYNLYADKLLQLNLIDKSIYELQTSFYRAQTSLWTYGFPLDSSSATSITRSDWMMFAAASASDDSVRNDMIAQVWQYASVNRENRPFPVAYYPSNGSWTNGQNSPAVGAMFAPLALNVPVQPVSSSGPSASSGSNSGSSSNVAVIVGATIGGLLGLVLIAGLIFFFVRRRRQQDRESADLTARVKPTIFASDSVVEPFRSTDIVVPPAPAPFHARKLGGSKAAGAYDRGPASLGNSSGSANSASRSSRPMPVPPHPTANGIAHHEELRSAVDDLRREIERIKEERAALGESPPSYEELANSLRAASVR